MTFFTQCGPGGKEGRFVVVCLIGEIFFYCLERATARGECPFHGLPFLSNAVVAAHEYWSALCCVFAAALLLPLGAIQLHETYKAHPLLLPPSFLLARRFIRLHPFADLLSVGVSCSLAWHAGWRPGGHRGWSSLCCWYPLPSFLLCSGTRQV